MLVTIEAALSGGVLLRCADGTLRDLASVHGTYRRVTQSADALLYIGQTLQIYQPACCRWYLDKPVSNSGRLKALIEEVERGVRFV